MTPSGVILRHSGAKKAPRDDFFDFAPGLAACFSEQLGDDLIGHVRRDQKEPGEVDGAGSELSERLGMYPLDFRRLRLSYESV